MIWTEIARNTANTSDRIADNRARFESCTSRREVYKVIATTLASSVADVITRLNYDYLFPNKVKLSMYQAVEAQRIVRRRDSHIF
jgi:chromosome condensin MukBEF ATPase and DNA-binding subunit MukB